jgi:outer membrane usher protein FimD/PapC
MFGISVSGRLASFMMFYRPRLLRVRFFLFLLLILFQPNISFSAEPMILSVVLNLEPKGDFIVYPVAGDDFLVKSEDLKAMGFRGMPVNVTEIAGEPYISLRTIPEISFEYNLRTLALHITVPPRLLIKKTLDFAPKRQENFYQPRESSAFLNYRANYAASSSGFGSFDLFNQLGARKDDVLFLTDSTYSKTPIGGKFVRLMTNFTYDRRDKLQRGVVGDLVASSGSIGSNVLLGGVSYAKVYKMDPYFITYPTFSLTRLVATPVEMEVYLDGMKMRTEKLSPGEIELKNLYTTFGAGLVELVIKDQFGREQRITLPYYLSDRLLKKGLEEYSYNLGFLRKNFAVDSNSYGKVAFSAFHRYGWDDTFTLGLGGEASTDFMSVAPQATILLGTAGIVSASLAASAGTSGKSGLAGQVGYSYLARYVTARLQLSGFSEGYATLESETAAEKKKYEIFAGAGYGNPKLGSLSLDIAFIRKYLGQDQDRYNLNYSRRLSKKLDLFSNVGLIRSTESDYRVFVGLTYSFGHEKQVSTWVDAGKASNKEVFQVQKNPPIGEGYGYRAAIERVGSSANSVYAINPAVQYNGRHGVYTADIRGESGFGSTALTYQFGTAGAIAYVGKTVALTRPINDSFAVVKVGELEGVRVYQNSQEIGRTDASGKIFVENLNSYLDNQISIDDKDIPLNNSLASVLKNVSPPQRSGSCIFFPTAKQQPITGSFHLALNGDIVPLEYLEVRITVDGRESTTPTGKGGEFYIDPFQAITHPATGEAKDSGCAALESVGTAAAKPLHYTAAIDYQGKTYTFLLQVPQSDEMFIDLGKIIVNAVPESAPGPKGAQP